MAARDGRERGAVEGAGEGRMKAAVHQRSGMANSVAKPQLMKQRFAQDDRNFCRRARRERFRQALVTL